ncbi:hypothetical protein MSPP1_000026 [Malassezia sp. CBS 17886]|nr:hypothetical protein MSPP1_000026 [Malassezia sp. CBS 17886]
MLPSVVPKALRSRLFMSGPPARPVPGRRVPLYEPAHVHHLMIFAPPLTAHMDAEDAARLTEQILFYTSIESTVAKVHMVRQVALASALIDFASSLQTRSSSQRRIAVSSQAQRFFLVEVQPGVWLHASVVLARAAPSPGEPLEPLPWLSDDWAHQQLQDAWDAWLLRHTPVDLNDCDRVQLENLLEPYFSKWVWQWDVENQRAPRLCASLPAPPPVGIVAETYAALLVPVCTPHARIATAVRQFLAVLASSRGGDEETSPPCTDATDSLPHVILLYDDQVLWPPPHMSDDASVLSPGAQRLVALYVMSELVGMGKARSEENARRTAVRSGGTADGVHSAENVGALAGVGESLSAMASGIALQMTGLAKQTTCILEAAPADSTSDAGQDEAHGPRPSVVPSTDTSKHLHMTSVSYQSFHDRLSHALDMGDVGADGDDTAAHQDGDKRSGRPPLQDAGATDAARQLGEITHAYVRASQVGPTQQNDESDGADAAHTAEASAQPMAYGGANDASAAAVSSADERTSHVASNAPPVETPQPWRHARLHVPCPSRDAGAADCGRQARKTGDTTARGRAVEAVDVMYTTRHLLTAVLVRRDSPCSAPTYDRWLAPSWEFLCAAQCIVDTTPGADADSTTGFLHVDEAAARTVNTLSPPAAPTLRAGIEAQLLAAEASMQCYGIRETLARDEGGAFWAAARCASEPAPEGEPADKLRTYLVLQGAEQRRYGMAECDRHLRMLAEAYSELGL